MSYSDPSHLFEERFAANGTIAKQVPRAKVRVLVADDHELIRSALACLLEQCGYDVVAQANNGAEALALWREHLPDIALLDLRMPVLDGIGAVNAVRQLDGNARVVILSTFDCHEHVTRAFAAGARGYLLKGVSLQILRQCIVTVCSGGRFIVPELAQRLAINSALPTPTDREIDVLTGVAQGLCNKRIARSLGIEEGTVKVHLKSILRKLEATSRTQAATIAIRRGLVQI
jgi:two-component system NarL family response regulator